MKNKETTIRILPDGNEIKSNPDMTLLESLMHQGIFLRSDCGGKGRCGKCKVLVEKGAGSFGEVKACVHKVEEDVSIKIPAASLLSSHVMDKAPLSFPESFIQRMAAKKGQTPRYGAAVDLGTTTIAVYLCDWANGEVLGSVALKNPQSMYGADVISRINAIVKNPENLAYLQQLVVNSIEWGLDKLMQTSQAGAISKMVVAGNPAMIHIFAGVNPESIGRAPYEPAFYEAREWDSAALGFTLEPFTVHTLPMVSGFIGGDTLAAALAAVFDHQPDGALLIDLGTNGELLFKNNGSFYAASCATGPAFEGAELDCGMQATPGAINGVEINGDQKVASLSVIGANEGNGVQPAGICGPGVISALAELYRKGVVKSGGGFKAGEREFVLFEGDPNNGSHSVYISQKDIRSIQLGKGALATGIEFLLMEAGLVQPEKILIAGAFGNHLNKEDIICLGMIPNLKSEKIEMAGNSAGAGAVMALCDDLYLQKAIEMAKKIQTIDLAGNVEFQKKFVYNLSFPEGAC